MQMYMEFVTVSKYYVLYFIPAQEKLFLSAPLRGFSLSPALLNVRSHCVSGQPGLRTSGNWSSYPPVPCFCHGVKELLTIMDFSIVYLPESMLCFASPDGDSVATFPFTTPHRLTFSLTFSHSACPHGTTTPVAIAQSFSTSSSSLWANPNYSYSGAWLKLV